MLIINHADLRVLRNCSLESCSCSNVMTKSVLLSMVSAVVHEPVPEASASLIKLSLHDIQTTVKEQYSEMQGLRLSIEDYDLLLPGTI